MITSVKDNVFTNRLKIIYAVNLLGKLKNQKLTIINNYIRF